MNSVNKLLIPIDFSPESEKALRYASSLAKQINAELIALHVRMFWIHCKWNY